MECDICREMPLKSTALCMMAHLCERPIVLTKTTPLLSDFFWASGVMSPLLNEFAAHTRATWVGQTLRASSTAVQVLSRPTWGVAPSEYADSMKKAMWMPEEAYPTAAQTANYVLVRHDPRPKGHCSGAALRLWALGMKTEDTHSPTRTEMLLGEEFSALLATSRGIWLHAIRVESDSIRQDWKILLDGAARNPMMPSTPALSSALRASSEHKYVRTERYAPHGQVERLPMPSYLWNTQEERAAFLYTAYNSPVHGLMAEVATYHAMIMSAAVTFRARRLIQGGFYQPVRGIPRTRWPYHE